MARIQALDARQKPPESIKASYKLYQKLSLEAISTDPGIIDFSRGLSIEQAQKCKQVSRISYDCVRLACHRFRHTRNEEPRPPREIAVFEHEDIPGLFLIPSLIPPQTQQALLSRLMHQTLADERHKTNVHAHHRIPYHSTHRASSTVAVTCSDPHSSESNLSFNPSFFNVLPESSELFLPLDPSIHKALTISQFLRRKLRWLTLGGQYDWTKKTYPQEDSPPFPEDIADLAHSIFPEMRPEAAIVNVYSPGDTLSIHRDVSEASDKGLISISLGCDGIFIAGFGNEDDNVIHPAHLAVRLRSGDAVYMSGQARFAWHGVPQIIPKTCPVWLSEWPATNRLDTEYQKKETDHYEGWRGWMLDKRINLNIRQMKD